MSDKKKCQITEDCFVDGKVIKKGEVVELNKKTINTLLASGRVITGADLERALEKAKDNADANQDSRTKAELLTACEEAGLEVSQSATKAQLLEALSELSGDN